MRCIVCPLLQCDRPHVDIHVKPLNAHQLVAALDRRTKDATRAASNTGDGTCAIFLFAYRFCFRINNGKRDTAGSEERKK